MAALYFHSIMLGMGLIRQEGYIIIEEDGRFVKKNEKYPKIELTCLRPSDNILNTPLTTSKADKIILKLVVDMSLR